MTYSQWDILLALVPFEDLPQEKLRPVLVLGDTAYIIDCLKMTSHGPRPGEYALRMWEHAGLRKPTTVRFGKRLRLDPLRVRKYIGHLHPYDIIEIQKRMKQEKL